MDQRYQINGFLPWRGPFVLDVIVIAMVVVLIALAWSCIRSSTEGGISGIR